MALDAFKNLAYSTVATAPSPADSGTELVVTTGHGGRFPTAPFNATVWPADEIPTPSNAEIVRVTGVSTDTLTIEREQESTTAREILVGDQIAASITALTLSTLESNISAVSAAVTSVDTHAGTASAAATSADGHAATASAAATSVNARVTSVIATEISNLISADAALSVRIDGVDGGAGSVTSDELSAVAAAASIVSTLATVANAHASVASLAATSADAHANTVSAAVETLSAKVVSISAQLTSLEVHASAASAAATSADAHANTVSGAVETLSAKVVSISAQLTSIETHAAAASAAATSIQARLLSIESVLSDRIDAIPGGGSVNAVGLITNETGNTVSSTTLVTVSGLSCAVSAGGVYRLEAIVMHTQSVAGGVGFGLTFPTMNAAVCQVYGGSVGPTLVGTVLSTHRQWGIFNETGSGSITYSVSASSAQNTPTQFDGVFNVQTGGVMHMVARVSVNTILMVMRAGSYMRVFKLN